MSDTIDFVTDAAEPPGGVQPGDYVWLVRPGAPGEEPKLFKVPPPSSVPGAAGIGISGAAVDGAGHLVLTRSDGSHLDAGAVVGPPAALPATATPVPVSGTPALSELRLLLADGTFLTGPQLAALLGGTAGSASLEGGGATATSAYATTLSAASGEALAPVTMTFTPTGGTWPAGTSITPSASGLAGAFSPTALSPTGSAAATCTFTPTAAGSGTLSSSTSPALSDATGALGYAATPPAPLAYTARVESIPFATSVNLAGADYGRVEMGVARVIGPANETPGSLDFAFGASSATPPAKGDAAGDYGAHIHDYGEGALVGDQANHPQVWGSPGSVYIWKGAHGTGTTRALYLWVIPTDGSAPAVPLSDSGGAPIPFTVTY